MISLQNSQPSIAEARYRMPQATYLPNSRCQVGNTQEMYTKPACPRSDQSTSNIGQQIGAAIQQAMQPLVEMFQAVLSKLMEVLTGKAGTAPAGGASAPAAPTETTSPSTTGSGSTSEVTAPPSNTGNTTAPAEGTEQKPAAEKSSLDKVFGAIKMIYEGVSEIGGLSKGLGKKASKGIKALSGFFSKALTTVGNSMFGGAVGKLAKGLLSKIA